MATRVTREGTTLPYTTFAAEGAQENRQSSDKSVQRHMGATSIALSGMQQAEGLLDRTASRLASAPLATTQAPGQDQVSLSDEAVNLLKAKDSFQANLSTVKVADEMEKSALSLVG
jgi:hypothetical protein